MNEVPLNKAPNALLSLGAMARVAHRIGMCLH